MSYETEYSQFVESNQLLTSLQDEDFKVYSNCGITYSNLNHLVDQMSLDYFEVSYGEEPLHNVCAN